MCVCVWVGGGSEEQEAPATNLYVKILTQAVSNVSLCVCVSVCRLKRVSFKNLLGQRSRKHNVTMTLPS